VLSINYLKENKMDCSDIPKYDMCLNQGESRTLRFDFTDEDDAPIDLTGSTLKFQVKDNINSIPTLLSALSTDVTGSRIEIGDQTTDQGGAYLIIEGADTVDLKYNLSGAQDLLRIDSNGATKYYFKGKFILSPTVSR
jgi:hypothetical protein